LPNPRIVIQYKMVQLDHIEFETKGRNEVVDITDNIRQIINRSGISDGSALVFVPGATGGLSTIEYEPGLIKDLPKLMEKLIPEKEYYFHNENWHDGNGHSHLKATLIGPSLTIPFENKRLVLGTWQQVVFLEFDNKPHHRQIVVQLIGE
jgi:secondary thiamine-phosphate synthase enzyme